MKLSKNLLLLTLTIFCPTFVLCIENSKKDNSEFVVQEETVVKSKGSSKNELKEDIATNMKATIDECAFISATVGEILEKIAKNVRLAITSNKFCDEKSLLCEMCKINEAVGQPLKEIGMLQQRYSANIENIIENKKPFKSAGHGCLKAALNDSSSLLSTLKSRSKKLDQLKINLFEAKSLLGKNSLQLAQEISISFKTQLDDLGKLRVQFCKNECLK